MSKDGALDLASGLGGKIEKDEALPAIDKHEKCHTSFRGLDEEREANSTDMAGIPDDQKNDSLKGMPDISNINIKDESFKHAGVERQEKVGSLTFKVIDASSQKKSSGPPKLAASGVGSSANTSQGPKATNKKPASRAKVPFQIGYSHMEWLKLTRTHPDLAGLKGQSNKRLISLSEVKQHQTEDSMWTVLKGRVYNITPYMKFHPGGVDMLMKAVGKDCTALFNKYHAWVNAEFMLEKCLVGILEDTRQ